MTILRQFFSLVVMLVLLITCISLFVALSPSLPSGKLDPSWVFGMNQSVAQGLAIGEDIVFTYGPYASIYTRAYHPATDGIMLFGGGVIATFYCVYLSLLSRKIPLRYLILFVFIMLSLVTANDVRFFSVPFILGILIYKVYCFDGDIFYNEKWSPYVVGLLVAPLGLLPLAKGSLSLICIAVAGIFFVYFMVVRLCREALAVIISPLIFMCLFWVVSGQSILGLPKYFLNMLPIISGYTEAMAIDGRASEVWLYVFASLILFVAVAWSGEIKLGQKLVLNCMLFVFLFLAFKAGFVRHDAHALQAGGAILLAAICLCWLLNGRLVFVASLLALLVWGIIDGNYLSTSTRLIKQRVVNTYSSAFHGVVNRCGSSDGLASKFDARIGELKKDGGIPVLSGTSDIYSYEQSFLIASGNNWSPRPILQSYSAYVPSLVERNRQHLQAASAPDNIFFAVQPIDGHFPALEDGASWLELLSLYSPVGFVKSYVLLKKKAKPNDLAQEVIRSGAHGFGEEIRLPESANPIFVRMKFKKTMLGRLVSFLYKPSKLFLDLQLASGESRRYRIVSGMTESGFLLSPLIERKDEFVALYSKYDLLSGKRVRSFKISSQGGVPSWGNEFDVEFVSVVSKYSGEGDDIFEIKAVDYSLRSGGLMSNCIGSIDWVNGVKMPREITIGNALKVSGWFASSVAGYSKDESTYIVFSDESERYGFARVDAMSRPDLAKHFKSPEMEGAGFNTLVDLSGLSGTYTMSLALKRKDEIRICSRPSVLVHVDGGHGH